MMKKLIALVLCSVMTLAQSPILVKGAGESNMQIKELRTEQLENPLGIDAEAPRLSWKIESAEEGAAQSAYRILAAESEEALRENRGELWDSGKTAAESFCAPFGAPLTSRQKVYWKVMVWDQNDLPSAWSKTASFEMGLTEQRDWTAQWIGLSSEAPGETQVLEDTFTPQTARYLKLSVTESGPYVRTEVNQYRVQIMELALFDGDHPTNLALGKAVTANSVQSVAAQWQTAYLTNGNTTTEGYTSASFASPQYTAPVELVVDLGAEVTFDRLKLYCRTDVPSPDGVTCANYPKRYSVLVSRDNVSYTNAYTKSVTTAPTISHADRDRGDISPLLAKEFQVQCEVQSARLYISGLGLFEASINGERISDTYFDPGETDYRKRVQFVTYDVTDRLKQGGNALGVKLGNGIYRNYALINTLPERYQKVDGFQPVDSGFYGPLKALAQLEITYQDGTTERIVTDESWQYTSGPTTFNNWYGGEDYDARLEVAGWDEYGTDRSAWIAAEAIDAPNENRPVARRYPPIRIHKTLTPRSVTRIGTTGNYLVDMGQNGAGFAELILPETSSLAGVELRMYTGEILNAQKTGVDQSTSTQGDAGAIYNQYTIKGTDNERWHPTFCYQGYRYLEVRGVPSSLILTVDNFRGHLLRAENRVSGSFTSSNQSLVTIDTMITNAIESNMFSSLTDCPQIEKLGWLEVSNLMFYSLSQTYDMQMWMEKIVQDVVDSQYQSGYVPAIAPEFQRIRGLNEDPNWGGVCVLLPWRIYEVYGSTAAMENAYSTGARYVEYLRQKSETNGEPYLIHFAQMGDWGSYPKYNTSYELVASCAFYNIVDTLAKTADVLGKEEDRAQYRALAEQIKAAVNRKYYNAATAVYDTNSQASYACPLYAGLVDESEIPRVLENLEASIVATDYHLSTGEVVLGQMFHVLAKYGRSDLVYKIATNRTQPSYWYFVEQNATTLPEYWDMARSQNHVMMGHVKEWFSRHLAGIDPAAPGYREVTIKPYLPKDVADVGATVGTPYGTIASEWTYAQECLTMQVTIPVGVRATVYVPKLSAQRVTLNGAPANAVVEGDYYRIRETLGAGHYTFTSEGRQKPDPSVRITSVDVTIAQTEQASAQNGAAGNAYTLTTVEASSEVASYGWAARNAIDGNRSAGASQSKGYGWSSAINQGSESTAWITVGMDAVRPVSQVILWPRNDSAAYAGQGFPIDFTIEVSSDNVHWQTVRTVNAHASTVKTQVGANSGYCFFFERTDCRYVRVNATHLAQAGSGSRDYCFQLSEIEVADDAAMWDAAAAHEIDTVYQALYRYSIEMDDDFYARLRSVIRRGTPDFSSDCCTQAMVILGSKQGTSGHLYNVSTDPDRFGAYYDGGGSGQIMLAQYDAENRLICLQKQPLEKGTAIFAEKAAGAARVQALVWGAQMAPLEEPLPLFAA